MNLRPTILCLAMTLAAVAGTPAFAQTAQPRLSIDPAHEFSWNENCGYMNWGWGTSPTGGEGGAPGRVLVGATCLGGYVWWENTGWMSLGHDPLTPPPPGQHYANTSDVDYGVNVDPLGALSGYAWSENAGWVNFSGGALASPPNPARFDHAAGRFRGYAWSENIGWINLDDTTLYVGTLCPADYNRDGHLAVQDVFDFLNDWFAGAPGADFDGDGTITIGDIFEFLTAWFSGC